MKGSRMMLIDEFANTRMWAAEAERQQREREQARQVREHARWQGPAQRPLRDAVMGTDTDESPAPANGAAMAEPEASAPQERELAHATR